MKSYYILLKKTDYYKSFFSGLISKVIFLYFLLSVTHVLQASDELILPL